MNELVVGSFAHALTNMSTSDLVKNLDTLILMDVSASMSQDDRWEKANKALAELQAKYPGRLLLAEFGVGTHLRLDGQVGPPQDDMTNLLSAIQFADPYAKTGMKIIIITDGEPNSNQYSLPELREVIVKAATGMKIHSIFCGDDKDGVDKDFLARLGETSIVTPDLLVAPIEKYLLSGG